MKKQRLREEMRASVKQSKQATLDTLPAAQKTEPAKTITPERKKQIEITEISTSTREDELVLKVGFRLLPSRTAFSRVTSDLYFDGKKMGSTRLAVIQGPLATDDSEFTLALGMKGIGSGSHIIRVEMYELWSSGEKLASVSREVTFEYVPVKREDRLIEIPIIKCVAGAGLVVVSDYEKNIYREIEKEMKRDSVSRRDQW